MLSDTRRDMLAAWLTTHCPYREAEVSLARPFLRSVVTLFGLDEAHSLCALGAMDAAAVWEEKNGPFYRLVQFKAADRLRTAIRKRRIECVSMPGDVPERGAAGPVLEAIGAELRERMGRLAGRLAPVLETMAEGCTCREVAERVGLSKSAALIRVNRVKKLLRSEVAIG